MNKIGFFGIVFGVALSTGCASAQLHSQLNALQAEGARQDKEIAELESKSRDLRAELAARDSAKAANDLAVDGRNLATSAFAWSSDHVVSAYHATYDKAAACYAATDFSSLHTWDDYKAAALKCWNLDPAASK
jgi:hypothetical protein